MIISLSVQAKGPDGQVMLYGLNPADDGDVHRYVYTPDEDVMDQAAEVMEQAWIEVGEGL